MEIGIMIMDVRFLDIHIEKNEAVFTINNKRINPVERERKMSEVMWSNIAMKGIFKRTIDTKN